MRRITGLVVLIALVLAACGGDDGPKDAAPSTSAARPADGKDLSGEITVLAASSLTEAFTELGKAFEADHPAVDIKLSFAASSALAEQIVQGAPADAFVSADEQNMDKVVLLGKATEARPVIARNRLTIAVGPGNPKGVRGLTDLARVDFVLCNPEVPCGKLGAAALAKAGVQARPKSLEENVKAVVSRVALGEVDAGIVYMTDVQAAKGKVGGVGIDIAADPALEAVYPMTVTADAANPVVAQAFLAFVTSGAGQQVLASFGFRGP